MAESLCLLHLYTGEGKGKTSAAMGLAVRALGHGFEVFIAQFLKNGASGELTALAQFPKAHIFAAAPTEKFTFRMSPAEREAAKCAQTGQVLRMIAEIQRIRPRLMVFDELAMCMQLGLLREDDGWNLIETGLTMGEVVTTGRYAPDSLLARADYVSEIVKKRHPFDRGICAREGVEW